MSAALLIVVQSQTSPEVPVGQNPKLDDEKLAPVGQTSSRASRELIKECATLDEIARVETFGEAAKHRRQYGTRLVDLASFAP